MKKLIPVPESILRYCLQGIKKLGRGNVFLTFIPHGFLTEIEIAEIELYLVRGAFKECDFISLHLHAICNFPTQNWKNC